MKVIVKTIDSGSQEFELSDEVGTPTIDSVYDSTSLFSEHC